MTKEIVITLTMRETLLGAGENAMKQDAISILMPMVPQTFAEAVRLYPWINCPSHEWDNRTTPENALWLIERLKAALAEALELHALDEKIIEVSAEGARIQEAKLAESKARIAVLAHKLSRMRMIFAAVHFHYWRAHELPPIAKQLAAENILLEPDDNLPTTVTALMEDARRYRWLRSSESNWSVLFSDKWPHRLGARWVKEAMDEAIDRALQSARGEKP